MDAYLEWHLRLAEKRGLLTGRSLSPPAVLGTELLYLLEMKDKAKEFWNRFRISLVAGEGDPERIRNIFPELFLTPPGEVDDDTDIDDIDLSQLEWSAPKTTEDFREFMKLREQLEEHETGVIKGPEISAMKGDWL